MKETRVLLLFSSSDLGGAERSLTRMASVPMGVSYVLATLGGEGPWCDWVRSRGHEPLVFGRGASTARGRMFGTLWRLVRYVRANTCDAIYVCGARASLWVRILRILFFRNVKVVHGIRWNPDSASRLDMFLRGIERASGFLVHAWIANSGAARETLVNRCGVPRAKIAVIHNGLENFPTDVPGLAERPLEVLTVANLSPRKGHREFLRVVKGVVGEVPDAQFVFVGRDDMNGEVDQAIREAGLSSHVRCAGFQADVGRWFMRARVFALPSLWNEGCPTAILEAMSYGVPCIAFALDGIPEMVDDEENGKLIEVGDYAGMTRAVVDLLSDVHTAARLGANGRNRVRSQSRVESTAEQHRSVFRSLLSETEEQDGNGKDECR